MPRIDAATVVEHRAQQRDALLDAAEALLLDGGCDALDFGALGERTGLRRTSVYRYFASRDELVAELCERTMPDWLADIDAALAKRRKPAGKAAAYVQVQLKMVASVRHRLALADALPDRATAVLAASLEDAGHPQPQIAAQLVTGLLNAAIRLVHDGFDKSVVADVTTAAARRAVRDAAAAA